MRWTRGCAATLSAVVLFQAPVTPASGQMEVDDATFTEPVVVQVTGVGGTLIRFEDDGSLSFNLPFDEQDPEGALTLTTPGYGVELAADTFIENEDGVAVLFTGDAGDGTVSLDEGAQITGAVAGIGALSSVTVDNEGTITATGEDAAAVALLAGGSVTNRGGGLIDASGEQSVGVLLEAGGTVDNEQGAIISGTDIGVLVEAGAATIENAGTIAGIDEGGIVFAPDATGTVTNDPTGTIQGLIGIDFQGDGGTVTQSGTITGTGGTAIQMAEGEGSVELLTGSSTIGNIVHTGGTGQTVTLSGTGIDEDGGLYEGNIVGFAELQKVDGGDWTYGGDGTFQALNVDAGELTLTGQSSAQTVSIAADAILQIGDAVSGELTVTEPPITLGAFQTLRIGAGGRLVGDVEVDGGFFRFNPFGEIVGQVTFFGEDDLLGLESDDDFDLTEALLDNFTGQVGIEKVGEGTMTVVLTPLEMDRFFIQEGTVDFAGPDNVLTVSEFLTVGQQATLEVGNLVDGVLTMPDESLVFNEGEITGGVRFSSAGTVSNLGTLGETDGISIAMGEGEVAEVNLVTDSSTAGDIIRTAAEPAGAVNLFEALEPVPGSYDGDITGFATLRSIDGQWTLGGESSFVTVEVLAGELAITGWLQTDETDIDSGAVLAVGDDDSGRFTAAEAIALGSGQTLRVGAGGVLEAIVNVDGGTFAFTPGRSDLTGATINFLGEDDTLGLDSDEDFDLDQALLDSFPGADSITKGGTGTMNVVVDPLSLDNFTIDEGLVVFDQPGSTLSIADTLTVRGGAELDVTNLIDSTLVMGEGSWLRGMGSIIGNVRMAEGSIMLPGESFGTIQIDGDVTYDAGSVLGIRIDSADPSVHDAVDLTGIATFQPGSIIEMIVVGEESLVDGTEVTIVTADGGFGNTVVDDIVIQSDPPLYLWTPRIEANSLVMTASEIPDTRLVDAAVGRSNRAIATVLQDVLNDDPESALAQQIAEPLIDFTPDEAAFNQIVNTLSPEPVDAMAISAFRNAQAFQSSLGGYLNQLRAGTPVLADGSEAMDLRFAGAARDPQMLQYVLAADGARHGGRTDAQPPLEHRRDPHTWSVFARGVGAFNNQLSTGDRTGFVAEGAGAVVGADYRIDERFLVGMSLGYTNTDLRYRDFGSEGEIDTFRFGPYVSYTQGHLFVDSSLTFGFHDNELRRTVFLPGPGDFATARSSFNSFDLSWYIGAGYDFTFDATTLTPLVSLQYTYYDQDGFNERGAAPANLAVSGLDTDSLRLILGGRVTHRLRFGQFQFVPEAMLGWSHEFLNDAQSITGRFLDAGDPFTVRGGGPSRNALILGAGVSALLDHNISAFFRYDGEIGERHDSHTLSGGLTVRF